MNFFKTPEEKELIKLEKQLKKLKKNPAKILSKTHAKEMKDLKKHIEHQKIQMGLKKLKKVSPKYLKDKKLIISHILNQFYIDIGKIAFNELPLLDKQKFEEYIEYDILDKLQKQAKYNAVENATDEEIDEEFDLLMKNTNIKSLIDNEKFKFNMIYEIANKKVKEIEMSFIHNYHKDDRNDKLKLMSNNKLIKDSDFHEWIKNHSKYSKYYKPFAKLSEKVQSSHNLLDKGDRIQMEAGKKINKKSKKIRKHSGINQQTGRLKKGYKYSGKKLKNGLPQIIKIQKKKK